MTPLDHRGGYPQSFSPSSGMLHMKTNVLFKMLRMTLALLCIAPVCADRHLGGISTVDGTTPAFLELSWRAMIELNKQSNDMSHWIPVKNVKIRKQVVAGYKIYLDVLVGVSDCNKSGKNAVTDIEVNSTVCHLEENGRRQICHFSVWQKAWENFEEINLINCENVNEEEMKRNRTKVTEHGTTSAESETKVVADNENNFIFTMPLRSSRNKNSDKRSRKIRHHKHSASLSLKKTNYAVWNKFSNFIQRYEKSYKTKDEMRKRFAIYKRNMRSAKRLQRRELGTAKYGETVFSDMSRAEFRQIMLPYKWVDTGYPTQLALINDAHLQNMAPDFDWRDHGAVTPVKNQGSCGSCWAFSTTGNIEGQWAIRKKKLISLSEQELVDCDHVDQGCNGGLPANAYKEIMRMGGLEPEGDYPYEGDREQCNLRRSDISVYINDSLKFRQNETEMAAWLFANGPISIGLNANAMQFYMGGISYPWRFLCSPKHLDHGVLIVGYGIEEEKPFWIIKNSWGERWGERGYYRLYRGKNVCGVTEMATSAIVD